MLDLANAEKFSNLIKYINQEIQMLSNKSFLKEEAYIGEELLSLGSEFERKCLVVKQSVQDGDYSLDEALKLYRVSQEDYDKFR